MNFIKKLLLATAIVLGTVASAFAQVDTQVGDYRIWTNDDNTIINTWTRAKEFNVYFGVSLYEDGEISVFLYYSGVEHGGGSLVGYATVDGGNTFKTESVEFLKGTGIVEVKELVASFDSQTFADAKEVWFAVNGQVFKFSLNGFKDAVNILDEYDFVAVNPFGPSNPFKG